MAFNQSPRLEAIREHLPKLARVRIATNLPIQYAALESLRGPQGYIRDFVTQVKRRRDFVVRRLNEMPGLSCTVPQGAFYAFPKIEDARFGTDKEFVLNLLESKGVLGGARVWVRRNVRQRPLQAGVPSGNGRAGAGHVQD